MILENLILSLPNEIITIANSNNDRFGASYLVGGAVRDYLDGKSTHDFDFVVERNAAAFARAVADHMDGVFYYLDHERDIARVLIGNGPTQRKFDFARQVGNTLEDDLSQRDFTVNAMALPLKTPFTLIDPLHGKADLKHRFLKVCLPNSMDNEPVRVLRAVRFVTQNLFSLLPETDQAIRNAASKVLSTSPERVRDEIFNILAGERTVEAIRLMDALGILKTVFPELVALKNLNPEMPSRTDTFGHTLFVLDFLERVFESENSNRKDKHANQDLIDQVRSLIYSFQFNWAALLDSQLCYSRSLISLLKFAVLYHDTGKARITPTRLGTVLRFPGHEEASVNQTIIRAQALALSNREIIWLRKLIASHMLPRTLEPNQTNNLSLQLYRIFQSAGPTAPLLACFYTADVFGAYGSALLDSRWKSALECSRLILDAWFNDHERYFNINPFLDGTQIQHLLNIPPTATVGKLRAGLMEAQVAGEVNNVSEAETFLRKLAQIVGN